MPRGCFADREWQCCLRSDTDHPKRSRHQARSSTSPHKWPGVNMRTEGVPLSSDDSDEVIVSEGELQGQLYLPRRRHGFGNLTRSGAASRRRRKNIRVGLAEVGVIGDVEKFCPELDLLSFRDSESLEERKVQVEQARSNDGLWRGIAVASR